MYLLKNQTVFYFLCIVLATGIASYFGLCLVKKHEKKKAVKMSQLDFKIPRENIKKVVLDNGMTILIFVNKAVPKVLMQVAYQVGSSVEKEGEKGLAHLIEHMIFKGTEKLSEGDIDSIARKYGASFNAFTSKEVTSYYFEVNKNNWRPFVHILSDCMKNARFNDEHLSSEMRAVLQELRMRKDNYWMTMLEKIESLMYPASHPYHYPIIGFKQDLAKLSADKLDAFYHKYYHPNKATFFVVGDIDPDQIVDEIKQHFGSIPSGTVEQESFPTGRAELTSHHTQMFQSVAREQLGCFWHIPGRQQVDVAMVKALSYLLAGGQGSRLYKKMVDEEKVATSVMAMPYQLLHDGVLIILAEPHNGKRAECVKIIRQEIANIIKSGVTDQELSTMVVNKQHELLATLQTSSKLVYAWIESFFTHGNQNALFEQVDAYKQVTSKDIVRFLRAHCDPILMGTVCVSPIPEKLKGEWHDIQKRHEEFEQKLLADNVRTTQVEEPKYVHTMPDPASLSFQFPRSDSSFTLPNGLKVILTKKGVWPLVSAKLLFKDADFIGGSRQGVKVDAMMDMLNEGTNGFTKNDNVSFFEAAGAQYSAKKTGISVQMLASNYDTVLKRFFTVLTQPTFDAQALEKVKKNFIDTIVRTKDDQRSVAIKTLRNKMYVNHPFGWTFDDAIDDLTALTSNQLKTLHTKLVGPERMVLSIAGNFDLVDMEKSIKTIFSDWSGPAFSLPEYGKPEFDSSPQDITMMRDQAVLALGRPSPLTLFDDDYIPVQLLNTIAFTSLGSRIYRLREQTGLFYAAGGAFAAGGTRYPGLDTVFSILTPHTLADAESKIRAMLNELGEKGIVQQELDAARQMYLKGLIDLVATNGAVASLMGRIEILGVGQDYYEKALARVQKFTVEQLNEICKKYFHDTGLATVRVGRFK